ncbi:hypothetical protein EV378_1437 [Pseudonocardia endophytica]|uniref:Uncharacterized protein n=1 Tax=Pseudonocardia endophytica TaxID=401976 RepID=A0A4R1HW04_PSEEN|nr:hypothetical protein EV378_1437 [Pseudonocardia endophytica]
MFPHGFELVRGHRCLRRAPGPSAHDVGERASSHVRPPDRRASAGSTCVPRISVRPVDRCAPFGRRAPSRSSPCGPPSPSMQRPRPTPRTTSENARVPARASTRPARIRRINVSPADRRAPSGSPRALRITARPPDHRAPCESVCALRSACALRVAPVRPTSPSVKRLPAPSAHDIGERARRDTRVLRTCAHPPDHRAFSGSARIPQIGVRFRVGVLPPEQRALRIEPVRGHLPRRAHAPVRARRRRTRVPARASTGSTRIPRTSAHPAHQREPSEPARIPQIVVRFPVGVLLPEQRILRIEPVRGHGPRRAPGGRLRTTSENARVPAPASTGSTRVLRISVRPADQRASHRSARPPNQRASFGSARVRRISVHPPDHRAISGSARIPQIGVRFPVGVPSGTVRPPDRACAGAPSAKSPRAIRARHRRTRASRHPRPPDQRAPSGSACIPPISARPPHQRASFGSACGPRITVRSADHRAVRGSPCGRAPNSAHR